MSVVVGGLQFLNVKVSDGAVTMADIVGMPSLVASVGTVAGISFYANQGLNTVGSYTNGPTGIASVTIGYLSATAPVSASLDLNGTPSNCTPIGPPDDSLPTYMGLDSNKTLGWTIPNGKYTGVEFNMKEVTDLAATTTLYCKSISSDPAPSGGSFSSGAPDIATEENKVATMVLLAK